MTFWMWIATASWLSLLLAYRTRKTTSVHLSFALLGIIADISLVLYLQLSRSAIQTAVSFTLSPLEQTHIVLSSLALLLYFPTLLLGVSLLFDNSSVRRIAYHRSFAISALTFRTLGFLFMFSMWK